MTGRPISCPEARPRWPPATRPNSRSTETRRTSPRPSVRSRPALIPSRSQEISAADAAITQAQAELDQIDVRIARQTVHAPANGIVQDVFFWPGEIVAAGQPILALLPPENRKIRFYVPEPQLSRFALGAKAAVSCDNCRPGLQARVIYISQQAEYTPPVIFSLQERGKLVFRVDARLDDPSVLLPLGLPIEARLLPAEAAK